MINFKDFFLHSVEDQYAKVDTVLWLENSVRLLGRLYRVKKWYAYIHLCTHGQTNSRQMLIQDYFWPPAGDKDLEKAAQKVVKNVEWLQRMARS